MNESVNPSVFIFVFSLAIIWFALVRMLFNRLAHRHQEKYVEMGSPTLFSRNSPGTTFVLLAFLLGREHRALNDRYLGRLSDFMLVYLSVYIIFFCYLMFFTNVPHS